MLQKVNVYVDGFNLYHAIDNLRDNTLKWINYKTLAQSFLRKDETLNRVVFFTAVLTWNREKQLRHKNFMAAQKAVGVEIVESNFKRVSKHCQIMDRYCYRHEEKQTDVAIATEMLVDALSGQINRIILITADSDQIPSVKMIRKKAPDVRIILAAPPGRETDARELGAVVHDRKPIKRGRLKTCMLPRNVYDAKNRKVAMRPALYEN